MWQNGVDLDSPPQKNIKNMLNSCTYNLQSYFKPKWAQNFLLLLKCLILVVSVKEDNNQKTFYNANHFYVAANLRWLLLLSPELLDILLHGIHCKWKNLKWHQMQNQNNVSAHWKLTKSKSNLNNWFLLNFTDFLLQPFPRKIKSLPKFWLKIKLFFILLKVYKLQKRLALIKILRFTNKRMCLGGSLGLVVMCDNSWL